jgi:hypothetical protein
MGVSRTAMPPEPFRANHAALDGANQARTAELRNLLSTERSLAEARKQMLTTWMGYQMARIENYSTMGLPAP